MSSFVTLSRKLPADAPPVRVSPQVADVVPGRACDALREYSESLDCCFALELTDGGHLLLRAHSADDAARWTDGLYAALEMFRLQHPAPRRDAAARVNALAEDSDGGGAHASPAGPPPEQHGRFEPHTVQPSGFGYRHVPGAQAPPLTDVQVKDRAHVALPMPGPDMMTPRVTSSGLPHRHRGVAAMPAGQQGEAGGTPPVATGAAALTQRLRGSNGGGSSGTGGGAPARFGMTEAVTEAFSRARHGKGQELEAMLLDGSVDPRSRDGAGNTLLHTAAQNNARRAAKAVLRCTDYSVSPPVLEFIDAQNAAGNTALHYCFAYGYHALGEYLLSLGADERIANVHGLSCYEGLDSNAPLSAALQTPAMRAGRERVAASRAYAQQRAARAERGSAMTQHVNGGGHPMGYWPQQQQLPPGGPAYGYVPAGAGPPHGMVMAAMPPQPGGGQWVYQAGTPAGVYPPAWPPYGVPGMAPQPMMSMPMPLQQQHAMAPAPARGHRSSGKPRRQRMPADAAMVEALREQMGQHRSRSNSSRSSRGAGGRDSSGSSSDEGHGGHYLGRRVPPPALSSSDTSSAGSGPDSGGGGHRRGGSRRKASPAPYGSETSPLVEDTPGMHYARACAAEAAAAAVWRDRGAAGGGPGGDGSSTEDDDSLLDGPTTSRPEWQRNVLYGADAGGAAASLARMQLGTQQPAGSAQPVDVRVAALCAAAAAWRAACVEALECAQLWQLLDIATNLAGLMCGSDDGATSSALAAAKSLAAQPSLMAVLADTLAGDGGDGAALIRVANRLPQLAASARTGADGAGLVSALARVRQDAAPHALDRANNAFDGAQAASRALLQRLGCPEGEPLASAGDALRTLHAFCSALATAAN